MCISTVRVQSYLGKLTKAVCCSVLCTRNHCNPERAVMLSAAGVVGSPQWAAQHHAAACPLTPSGMGKGIGRVRKLRS